MKNTSSMSLLAFVCVLPVGCNSTSTDVSIPAYSPAASARQAFTNYDKNNDSILDAAELESCPALKSFAVREKKERGLSPADLEARLAEFASGTVGAMRIQVEVRRHGQPLPNAVVVFVPESFHGDSIAPASGVLDKNGRGSLTQEQKGIPGIAPGFYRIQVSLKDGQDKEMIPACFNTNSKLGEEVHARRDSIQINLEE